MTPAKAQGQIKLQIRNSKSETNPNDQKAQNFKQVRSGSRVLDFVFECFGCFEFRYSDFGFCFGGAFAG